MDTHFRAFFNRYTSLKTFLPLIHDENQFLIVTNKLIAQPSIQEKQINRQIAHTEEKHLTKDNTSEQRLHIHYTHEKRFGSLKRDIHQIYSEVFQNTDASKIRLIIGHRNSRNIQCELIQKQPSSSFIKLK